MCGIIGIVGAPGNQVANSVYDGLIVLQHRGQDAAGIVTSDSDNICHRRANGLVRDVFLERHMKKLVGTMGIGHVRYPTAGSNSSAEAQPFYTNTPFGVSLAHNGNLNNTPDIISGLLEYDHRRINTSSDSEALLNLFAAEIENENVEGTGEPQKFKKYAALPRGKIGCNAPWKNRLPRPVLPHK